MEHYAGIDVSLERSSVCVVDATGRIIREAKVASEPEALVRFFRELGVPLARVGLDEGCTMGRLEERTVPPMARGADPAEPRRTAGGGGRSILHARPSGRHVGGPGRMASPRPEAA